MTETEWLASTDPAAMVAYLRTGLPGAESAGAVYPLRPCPIAPSPRKLRLFACGCCREVWPQLSDPRSRRAVEVAERYADGLATIAELSIANHDAFEVYRHLPRMAQPLADEARMTCQEPADYAARYMTRPPQHCPPATQAVLIRDIFGNPFADRTWLIHRCPSCGQEHRWHWHGSDDAPGQWPYCSDCRVEMRYRCHLWTTPTVTALATAIYQQRAWEQMPILADALEEAGCEDRWILAHCRGDWINAAGERVIGFNRHLPHVRGCWVLDLLTGRE